MKNILNKKQNFSFNNPENEYCNDYHGHPNYYLVFGIIFLLFISAPFISSFIIKVFNLPNSFSVLSSKYINYYSALLFFTFSISFIKSLLVINYFMHLKYESGVLLAFFLYAILTIIILIIGTIFDVSLVVHSNYEISRVDYSPAKFSKYLIKYFKSGH